MAGLASLPTGYQDLRSQQSAYAQSPTTLFLIDAFNTTIGIHLETPTFMHTTYKDIGAVKGNLMKTNVFLGNFEFEKIDTLNDQPVKEQKLDSRQWTFASDDYATSARVNTRLNLRNAGQQGIAVGRKLVQAKRILDSTMAWNVIKSGARPDHVIDFNATASSGQVHSATPSGATSVGSSGVKDLTPKTFVNILNAAETDFDVVRSDMWTLYVNRPVYSAMQDMELFQSRDFNQDIPALMLPHKENQPVWQDFKILFNNLIPNNEATMWLVKDDVMCYGYEQGVPKMETFTNDLSRDKSSGYVDSIDFVSKTNIGFAIEPDGINTSGGNKNIIKVINAFSF